MIQEFLQFQVLLRLYHWSTKSYPRHIASGSLYEKLDVLMDKFIETAQGGSRTGRIQYKPFRLTAKALNDQTATKLLQKFAAFLSELSLKSHDLKNLRDEMLGEVEQTLYLFSLRM